MKRDKVRSMTCEGKKRFSTYRKAERAIKGVTRHLDKGARLGVYHCNFCNGFHIGNSAPTEARKVA